MTTDDFAEAARAEADERYPIKPTAIRTVALHGRARADFADGAEWARTYLAAQEPTDAEVGALQKCLYDRTLTWVPTVEARAALSAARRNEENR